VWARTLCPTDEHFFFSVPGSVFNWLCYDCNPCGGKTGYLTYQDLSYKEADGRILFKIPQISEVHGLSVVQHSVYIHVDQKNITNLFGLGTRNEWSDVMSKVGSILNWQDMEYRYVLCHMTNIEMNWANLTWHPLETWVFVQDIYLLDKHYSELRSDKTQIAA
jgi:hypothetical protein